MDNLFFHISKVGSRYMSDHVAQKIENNLRHVDAIFDNRQKEAYYIYDIIFNISVMEEKLMINVLFDLLKRTALNHG